MKLKYIVHTSSPALEKEKKIERFLSAFSRIAPIHSMIYMYDALHIVTEVLYIQHNYIIHTKGKIGGTQSVTNWGKKILWVFIK